MATEVQLRPVSTPRTRAMDRKEASPEGGLVPPTARLRAGGWFSFRRMGVPLPSCAKQQSRINLRLPGPWPRYPSWRHPGAVPTRSRWAANRGRL